MYIIIIIIMIMIINIININEYINKQFFIYLSILNYIITNNIYGIIINFSHSPSLLVEELKKKITTTIKFTWM